MGSPLPRKQVSGSLPFRRWFIATRLAELRESAGLSPEQAAKKAGLRPSVIYRAENADNLPQPRTLRDLLEAYRADQQTTALLLDLRREPDRHEWWEPFGGILPGDYGLYISCESRARTLHNYEVVVPGLLQTDNYARDLIRGTLPELTDEEVQKRVNVRMERRARLTAPEPFRLHTIVDESALIRPIGGTATMREQLNALTDLPETVTLQVVPWRVGAYPQMGWPFVVVQLRDPRAPTLLFTERSVGHSVVDGDDDLRHYASTWERIQSLALTPERSRELVAATARKLK